MQYEINALVQAKSGPEVHQIFGHSTKGVPGIEILGPGPSARQIKEKFMYLSKRRGIKIPLKRYILCLSETIDKGSVHATELQWLELPLLILFWRMVGVLPLSKTEDCLTSGIISPQGLILQREKDLGAYFGIDGALKLIFPDWTSSYLDNQTCVVDIEELFSGIENLKFKFEGEKKFSSGQRQ